MTSTTVPSTIQLRPGRLVAMLLAAVTVTAAVTWYLAEVTFDTSNDQSSDAAPAAIAATPHDLQAAYADIYAGRLVPSPADHALAKATLAAGVAPGAMPARSWPAATPDQLRDAWTGLTGASTGIADETAVTHPWAGIGGAGVFIPQPLGAAYIGLTAGSTGVIGS